MHRYIDEEIDPLYQRNSFPVDNMSKTKKMVCYNVMTLLYLHDKEKLEKCRKMSYDVIGILFKYEFNFYTYKINNN